MLFYIANEYMLISIQHDYICLYMYLYIGKVILTNISDDIFSNQYIDKLSVRVLQMTQKKEAKTFDSEFTIDQALTFAGDNSSYQKKRLLILSIMILTFAALTCRVTLKQGSEISVIFLFASGIGQVICPIYMSIRTITLAIMGCCIFGFAFYPVSSFLMNLTYIGLAFFGRGFFVSSLIYLNEIGGDKFRAWSMIVVFAIWGLSPFYASLETMFNIPKWVWVYGYIFIPFSIGSYFVLKFWKPSPFKLYTKRMFRQAKEVLNDMALQNNRSNQPYGLAGEHETDEISFSYKKPTYFDIIHRPIIRKITIPLLVLWVFRQYIYYGSYLILPEIGTEQSKNLILMSISETVAVLLSYPIRLKIKRVNAFFGFALLILIASILSSFTTVSEECMQKGYACSAKYIYRMSIMLIRFSIALTGNILIAYTLEIYPANVRSLGFSLCLAVSSIGSTLMPWINQTFIYIDLSGFISFALASFVALFFITKMTETHGKMRMENLEELEQSAPIISLKNWATLNF